jgi:hypothetical protein
MSNSDPSSRQEPVRVFIGSGEASRLERKTLIYSLKKNTQRPLDLYVFNGTHNAIEHEGEPPVLAPLPLHLKYHNVTEFSLYRYLIPRLCNYQGKAIHLDSDTICLGDIGELFDTPMNGNAILAKRAYSEDTWGTSVSVFDCSQCRFDLEEIFQEIERGEYSYTEFSQFHPKFLAKHPLQIGKLDANWNVFDQHDASTRLIHYTDLYRQPWKFPHHPDGGLWFQYFNEARQAGFVTDEDIDLSISRAYVRRDILQGNSPPAPAPLSLPARVKRKLKSLVG